MVNVLIGDIFQSRAQTLVIEVTCVGTMGKGDMLEFRQRFPGVYKEHRGYCKAKLIKLGEPHLYRCVVPPWVITFPTKEHGRSATRLEYIVRGLEHLERHHREWGIISLAVPPLGCGKGQLEWHVVGPTLYRHLNRFSIPVELYAPAGTPDEELRRTYLERALLRKR